MDVYITPKNGGRRLALAMLPEKISCSFGANMQSYTLVNGSDVQFPRGVSPDGFQWNGTLPGESRKNASYIKKQHWRSPTDILKEWEKWRKNGTRLRLMVTETPINYDVWLTNFDPEISGGNGDFAYSISFARAGKLSIDTVDAEMESGALSAYESRPSAEESGSKTYTVVRDDTLWGIAQKCLGNGSRYPDIYALNKADIDARNKGTGYPKYTIYAGQVFTLPG